MKTKILAAAAATVVLAGPAFAQNWSGFHAGVSGSYHSGSSDADLALGGAWSIESAALRNGVTDLWSTELDPSGTSFGIYAGYNRQFTGGFVLGGEVGYAWYGVDDSRLTGQTAIPGVSPTYAVGNAVDVESALTARANLGWDFGAFLGYAILGYTWADVSATAEVLSSGGYSKLGVASENLGGVTYGLGATVPIEGRWYVRLEYTRTDFEDFTFDTAYRAGSTFTSPVYSETFTQDLVLDTVSVGVGFRF